MTFYVLDGFLSGVSRSPDSNSNFILRQIVKLRMLWKSKIFNFWKQNLFNLWL